MHRIGRQLEGLPASHNNDPGRRPQKSSIARSSHLEPGHLRGGRFDAQCGKGGGLARQAPLQSDRCGVGCEGVGGKCADGGRGVSP